jgi:hypothetical protein
VRSGTGVMVTSSAKSANSGTIDIQFSSMALSSAQVSTRLRLALDGRGEKGEINA